MIPSAFDYQAPTSVDDALAALAAAGDEGKILAGGQSLLPVMRLRLAAPEVIVDLGRITELQGVRDDGDAIIIGAMTPHHVVANDPLVAEHAALLAKATQTVADPQVRHRGTFGGALAHADPAGDLLAPTLALDAEFEIAGSGGRRTVPASEFFVDLFTTALGDDEILTSVRVPKTTGWGSHYQKFTRVAQQWSIVGVAAAVRVESDSIAEARIGLTNMGSTPVRASSVEQALAGCALDESAIAAATASAGEGTNPPSDTNGDADYRRHLAGVLTARAVSTAGGVVISAAGAA
ncbi:FAD binding domain-containing protein [Aeromicrobium sp.]|uniref:FAD binding domain-containing protein n=1 Tax=Aeromicrobium sp. TaxID=1871063 RepID=UPI003C438C3E